MTNKQELIYQDLRARYKRATISKAEYADEVGQCVGTIDRRIKDKIGLPPYKKLGKAKNAKVVFTIIDVAEFLADTIKVVA